MSRSWRPVMWGGLALGLFAVATALASPTFSRSSYDPQSAAPSGSRAVAELLRAEGVTVERTTDLDRALGSRSDETLVVAYPWLLPRTTVRDLQTIAADVVMLGAVRAPTGYRGVAAGVATTDEDRPPACDLRSATLAGSARAGGTTLVVDDPAPGLTSCYPAAGLGPTMVQLTDDGGSTTTVVGSADFLTNEWVDDSGNAALAMNLLGGNERVVWWLPGPGLSGQQPLTALLPRGVWPVVGALVAVVLLLAIWQGRRLGPVVAEPLPVVVSASETTEGRARMYQRHKTRALAARHLRELTAAEVADRLGLPRGAGESATVEATAVATGRSADDVARVLYGPPPERDDDLVTLGRQLADLAEEVRRS